MDQRNVSIHRKLDCDVHSTENNCPVDCLNCFHSKCIYTNCNVINKLFSGENENHNLSYNIIRLLGNNNVKKTAYTHCSVAVKHGLLMPQLPYIVLVLRRIFVAVNLSGWLNPALVTYP